MAFNNDFYTPNRKYTRDMAEARLLELGYKNFHFKSVSYSNGASFYFESEDGKEIRVSDHPLTGKRAFDFVQIAIVEPKVLSVKKSEKNPTFESELAAMIERVQAKKQQKND